jgi:hypothetical protein
VTEQTDPTVDNVRITSDTEETYSVLNAGDNVSVTATFSELVIVTDDDGIGVDNASGTPTLTIAVGSDNRTATYVSGNNSTALVFQYTIQSGDNDTNGISIDNDSIALNSGTIRDTSGNYAGTIVSGFITHGSWPDNDSYKVDNTAPTLSSVAITSSTSGTEWNESQYNHVLSVTATFNETVTFTGSPELDIRIGMSGTFRIRTVDDVSGNNSTALVFEYPIQNGDRAYFDSDGVDILEDSLSLNGGTIKDLAGNGVLTQSDNDTIAHDAVDPNPSYKVK